MYSKKELLDSLRPRSRWSRRFVWAAVVQGLIAATTMILLGVVPIRGRSVVAGLFADLATPAAGFIELAAIFGFFAMYIVIGVVGMALTALLYYHVEVVMGKTCAGIANLLAWFHFLLTNIGIAGATWPMICAGSWGDIALGSTGQGGLGWTLDQVTVGVGIPLTGIGILAGIVGFLITLKR